MISFRELAGMGLAGLISATIEPQEIPKNFGPVGRVISQEEDKNNNGVLDTEEKVIDYNNSTYKYFRVYNKETKKQTYFIADKEYKIIKDPVAYYHLFSVITINESMTRAKKQNFEEHLTEWAEDYQKINKAIARMEYIKKSMESIFELEGSVINKRFFGDTKAPEALDYLLVKGSEHIAKKRTSDDFDNILKELAGNLSKDKPKDIAKHVLDNMKNITTKRIDNARSHLLFARKILENYNPDKDFLSLSQAEKYVENIIAGLEGITYARAYTASLGPDNSLIGASKIIAENFTKGFTGVSVDEIYSNLTKNEQLKKIKDTISESRIKLAKSLGSLLTALDPKQDQTLKELLLATRILDQKPRDDKLEDKVEIEWSKEFNINILPKKSLLSKQSPVYITPRRSLVGKDGSIYIFGWTETASRDRGIGKNDVFIMKTNKQGDKVWINQYGAPDSDYLVSIAKDKEDNIYAVTIEVSKPKEKFLIKYDKDGKEIWKKNLTKNINTFYTDVIADNNGQPYIIGLYDFKTKDGHGTLFEKYSSEGRRIWTRQSKKGLEEKLMSLACDKENNIYITGCRPKTIKDNSYGSSDVFVVKYTSDGKRLLSSQIEEVDEIRNREIKLDKEGNIYSFKEIEGKANTKNKDPSSIILTKFDGRCNQIWTRQIGSKNSNFWVAGTGLTIDDQSNTYLAGIVVNLSKKMSSIIVKYDKEGKEGWVKKLRENYLAHNIISDESANLYAIGYIAESGELFITKFKQK